MATVEASDAGAGSPAEPGPTGRAAVKREDALWEIASGRDIVEDFTDQLPDQPGFCGGHVIFSLINDG